MNLGGDDSVKMGGAVFASSTRGVDGFVCNLKPGTGNAGNHPEEGLKKLLGTHGWADGPVSMSLKTKTGSVQLQLIIREPKGGGHHRNFSVNIDGGRQWTTCWSMPPAFNEESLVYTVEVEASSDTIKVVLIPGNSKGGTDGVPVVNATLEDVTGQEPLAKPGYFAAFAEGQAKWEAETLAKLEKKRIPSCRATWSRRSRSPWPTHRRPAVDPVEPLLRHGPGDGRAAQAGRRVAQTISKVEKSIKTMLVTETEKPRMTRILPRGNWLDDSGEEVCQPCRRSCRKPSARTMPGRTGWTAKWIMDAENPLTSRAYVNRMWKLFFGTGLSSLDDLGGQGEPPTHPELLDWLATEFVQNDWDMKHIVRLLVTSGAYRQASVSSANWTRSMPDRLSRAKAVTAWTPRWCAMPPCGSAACWLSKMAARAPSRTSRPATGNT